MVGKLLNMDEYKCPVLDRKTQSRSRSQRESRAKLHSKHNPSDYFSEEEEEVKEEEGHERRG